MKYLQENRGLGSDGYYSFKYFAKNALVTNLYTIKSGRFFGCYIYKLDKGFPNYFMSGYPNKSSGSLIL